jgi:Chaperone of endosialidase
MNSLVVRNASKKFETYYKQYLKLQVEYIGAMILAFTMLSPVARAVDPPPGGGYPGGNTALGDDALFSQPDGLNANSTAIGFQALYLNAAGGDANTAVGYQTLYSNTTGIGNAALGWWSLHFNTTGDDNTAIGAAALAYNTTGYDNTATGEEALEANTTGFDNTATGDVALTFNTTGIRNTAMGVGALGFNTNGSENTGLGTGALNFNTTGTGNTAVGDSALSANSSGSGNIALGQLAGSATTGSNNIDIGNDGVADESGVIRIGTRRTHSKTFIQGISKVTVSGGVAVVVNTNGQLGTMTSSARYKEAIKPMKEASEAVLSLQPVTFRYKKEYDPAAIPQFGLIAEQVAKVDPDLVARDEEGKPYTVRYEAVNAMLLNEFLKEHRRVEEQTRITREQETSIAELKATVAELQAGLKAQAKQLQKVSNQVEPAAGAPRLVEAR